MVAAATWRRHTIDNGVVVLPLLLACGTPAAELPLGQVQGRTWSSRELGLALDFGTGWALAVDPVHFRSGLTGTVLEARQGQLSVAVTWQPLPSLAALDGLTALDLLPTLQPTDTETQGYRLERVAGCPELAERHAGELVQLGLRVDSGLVVFQGWGADPAPLRELACGARRL